MDKQYLKLFIELSQAMEALTEEVRNLDIDKGKEDEAANADTLRDSFVALSNKLTASDFNGELTRAEYARLLIGAIVIQRHIEARIQKLNTGLKGYKVDIVPKLERILNETTNEDNEKLQTLAKELFSTKS